MDPAPLAGRIRAVLLALVVALALDVLAAVMVTQQVRESVEVAERATGAQAAASELRRAVLEQQAADRGYLITGDGSHLDRYHAARDDQHAQERHLSELLADDPGDVALWVEVEDAVQEWNGYADAVVASAQLGPQAAADAISGGDGEQLSETFRSRMDALQGSLDVAKNDAMSLIASRQDWLVGILAATLVACTMLLWLGIRLTGAISGMRVRLMAESSAAARRDLLGGQEDERRQLASGIHDDTIQAAVAAALRLQRLRRHLAGRDGRAAELLDQVDADLSAAIQRLRRMVFELHPPTLDEQGLESALRLYLQETAEPAGLRWDVEWSGSEPDDPVVCSVAYRLFREAVWNTVKHAEAASVHVTVDSGRTELVVTVADDGKGVGSEVATAPRPGHLGVPGSDQLARASGGSWLIEPRPGGGTAVSYVLPQRVR